MKKSPVKKTVEEPQPLNTYGLKPVPGLNQLHYDRFAFKSRMDIASGCPLRNELFWRVADKILPKHFERHAWTEKVVNTMCDYPLSAYPGCCVIGSTRILNPLTGEQPTIQELCEKGIAPVVMTLDGPAQATIPFLKGTEDLFEVVLENGACFVSTLGHRVLLPGDANRWCRVGDLRIGQCLLSYEPNLRESTSESCLSNPPQDVHDSLRTIGDCRAYYSPYSRPYGEPLRFEEVNGQSFFPSQGDARTHTPPLFCWGEQEKELQHIHACPIDARPSMTGCDFPRNSYDIPAQLPKHRGTDALEYQWCQPPDQFRSGNSLLLPSSKPNLSSFGIASREVSLHQRDRVFYSYGIRVSQPRIVSITRTHQGNYYDLSVPGPEHYFAEGCIHHNSSAAKTYNVISFATVWWLMNPKESSVLLVSTTRDSLKKRGWAEVRRCYSDLVPQAKTGNLVDSRMMWQAVKGDDKHSIYGKAVEEGSVDKVADDIKGIHTKRQMVVIDEATSVPRAIYDACANLYSYPIQAGGEFVLVLIGNPLNRMDQFGRFCEPEHGWPSVSVETGEWDGKPQIELGGFKPRVVTFDAEKSPNIVEGRIVSRHLPTKEMVEAARLASGGGNTPLYWQNKRGFWPPEGITKTVFSQSALDRAKAMDKQVFTGRSFQIIATFDPAFGGGDRPVLRFAKLGELVGGQWGIESMLVMIVPLDSNSTNPIHFQLAEQVRRACERIIINNVEYSCPPENLGVDATGEGGGLCDIMQRTWNANIIRIEFGGRASEDCCSLEDSRKACDVYLNKTTEMHFRAKNAVDSGQLKGIDKQAAQELCNRLFEDMRPDGTTASKIKLQSKKEYRALFKSSPDYGDCFIEGTFIATDNGEVEIENIKIGDMVKTPFGSSPVTQIHTRYVSETTTVEFSDGSSLEGKGSHKIFVWNRGWVRMDELSLTNECESIINMPIWNLLNSLFTKDESTVFKLLVDTIRTKTGVVLQRDFYTDLSGVSTTVLFLKTCASIIKMAIGRITESKIWNSLKGRSIPGTTSQSVTLTRSIPKNQMHGSLKDESRPLSGMVHQKVWSGILKTVKKRGLIDRKNRLLAAFVVNPFFHSLPVGQNIAPSHVKTNTPTQNIRTLLESVLFAALNLLRSGSVRQRTVPVSVRQLPQPEKRKVINLTLENHNVYYANGILVQNCLVMLLEVARRKGFRLAAQGQTASKQEEYSEGIKLSQQVFDEDSLYGAEIMDEMETV